MSPARAKALLDMEMGLLGGGREWFILGEFTPDHSRRQKQVVLTNT